MQREGSLTDLRARLVGVVKRELQATFPPSPSERAALIRASMALGMTPEALRPHYRGEVQKPDAALIGMCRLLRGASSLAEYLDRE